MGQDWHRGMLVEVEINAGDVVARHYGVEVSSDSSYRNVVVRFAGETSLPEVSGEIANGVWREEFAKRKYRYLIWIFSLWSIWRCLSSKLGVMGWLPPSRRQLLTFEDYLFCPAHRGVVLKAIEREC